MDKQIIIIEGRKRDRCEKERKKEREREREILKEKIYRERRDLCNRDDILVLSRLKTHLLASSE